jgi:hypothetical protein
MAVVEQIVIATGVMGLCFVIATVAVAFVVVRGVRRRYRALRRRLMPGWGGRPDLEGLLRSPGAVAAASLGSPGWWVAQNRRHRMWRAVTSAEHAVRVARQAGVPVGDLPALAQGLRRAANRVDALLRASGRMSSLRDEDRADSDRIIAAAADLRAAALATLRYDSHADTDTVVSAVEIEVAALAAGIRAARL